MDPSTKAAQAVTKHESTCGIGSIPPEIILAVGSYLSQSDRYHFMRTCRIIRDCVLSELYKEDRKTQDNSALWKACEENNIVWLDAVLAHSPAIVNVHFCNRHESRHLSHHTAKIDPEEATIELGSTPLAVAIIRGHVRMVKKLLGWGADPNLRNELQEQSLMAGMCPIHIVMKLRNVDKKIRLLEILAAHGADLNMKPIAGGKYSPGQAPVFKNAPIFSVAYIPIPSTGTFRYHTSLYEEEIANMMRDQLDFLETLLQLGADPNIRDNSDRTPLIRFVELLAEWQPSFPSNRHLTASYDSREQGEVYDCVMDHIKLLVQNLADVRAFATIVDTVHPSIQERMTALHLACDAPKGNEVLVRYLVEQGSDINALSTRGRTPLFGYCEAEPLTFSTFEWLLERGALVNHQDSTGATPLHAACCTPRARETDRAQFVRALIAHGADVSIRDSMGFTAEDYADQWGNDNDTKQILADVRERRYQDSGSQDTSLISQIPTAAQSLDLSPEPTT